MFQTNTQLVNFAAESTPGVYASAVETADPFVRFDTATFGKSVEIEDNTFLSGDWGNSEVAGTGAKLGTASLGFKLTGGEFTPAPIAHKLTYKDLLSSVGLDVVGKGVGALDATAGKYHFFPASSEACKSLSLARFFKEACGASLEGYMETLRGCMGTYSISVGGRGQPFVLGLEYQGSVEKVEKVELVDIPVFDDDAAMHVIPDKFLNTTITLTNLSKGNLATTHCVSTLTLDGGNVISEIECQETDSGILNHLITDIAPMFTIDPALRSVTDFDAWGSLVDGDVYNVEVQSESLGILIPRAQMTTAEAADANGFMRTSIAFRPLRNSGSVLPVGLLLADVVNVKEAMFFITVAEKLADF